MLGIIKLYYPFELKENQQYKNINVEFLRNKQKAGMVQVSRLPL